MANYISQGGFLTQDARAASGRIHFILALLGGIILGGIASTVFPAPRIPSAVLFSVLAFLGVLGIFDPSKMLMGYFFFIPLININFQIDHASFGEDLYASQAYRKGVHFDGAAALLVAALWIAGLLRGNCRLPKDPPFWGLWGFYLATSFLAILLSDSDRFAIAWWSIGEQFTYFALFLSYLSIVREKETADKILLSLILGGTFAALAALVNLGMGELGMAKIHFFYWSYGPSESFPTTIPHRNFFGALMLITIPLSFGMFLQKGLRNGEHRLLWYFCLLIQIAALTFARSKGAILGVVTIGLFLTWKIYPRLNQAIILVFVLVTYGTAAVFWAANSPGAGSPVAVSSEQRIYILQASFPLPFERFWTGYGLNAFSKAFLELERRSRGSDIPPFRKDVLHGNRILETSAHNSFLNRLVETGLLGFVSFITLLGYAFYRLRHYYLKNRDAIISIPLYIAAILLGFCIQAFSEDLFSYSKLVIILWGLVSIGMVLDQGKPIRNSRGGVTELP